MGEMYKKGKAEDEFIHLGGDLQERTDIQRSWMYKQDEGVEAAAQGFGGPKVEIPKEDNALSLPLGEGFHT